MNNLATFDPNSLAEKDSNIFGLPFTIETAKQVVIPVPWEVTVSYRAGTAKGPKAIFDASKQVDLFDPELEDAWKIGIAMDEIPDEFAHLNETTRLKASHYIESLESGRAVEKDPTMSFLLSEINKTCEAMNSWVQERARTFLDQGKLVALIGGDHSTPLGLMRELGERYKDFGILHFDAHADLRDAYEGFTYSHASIMFNALKIKSLSKLVQVGIRDYCQAEYDLVKESGGRVISHYDRDIKERLYEGVTWKEICREAVDELPESVYVSFDIDGLDPKLCPNTGTPVAGGLEVEQALYMIKCVVRSGRKIIGFDINEVAPGDDEWDANVGARLLYRIANLAAKSNGLKA